MEPLQQISSRILPLKIDIKNGNSIKGWKILNVQIHAMNVDHKKTDMNVRRCDNNVLIKIT